MFSVLFEVHPKDEKWDTYLGLAKMLKPELEKIEGFVDNIRYKSLTRPGWVLSLSSWTDEKAVVRWRTQATHHDVQGQGRDDVFLDYRLRVGQITADSDIPEGCELKEQRLDETEVVGGTTVVLLSTSKTQAWVESTSPDEIAAFLGFNKVANGLVSWDVFDAVLTPGDVILLAAFQEKNSAQTFDENLVMKESSRHRQVRVIRHYSMFDRHEAPQYYPPIERVK